MKRYNKKQVFLEHVDEANKVSESFTINFNKYFVMIKLATKITYKKHNMIQSA